MTPKFFGTIEKGKLILYRQEVFAAYAKSLDGKNVEIILRERLPLKTDPQLKYFHGVVCECFADYIGCHKDEAKEVLKAHFLKRYITSNNGKELEYVPSLAKLKKREMSDFIDHCVILGAQMGIVIPSPNEVIQYGTDYETI